MAIEVPAQSPRPSPFGHTRISSQTSPIPTSESKLALSQLKGKSKESEAFYCGWWDYTPLLEGRKPPVQWTSSSLILFASTTGPNVECLHFPTNRHFTLPNPPTLFSNPASYESPSLIVASDRDEYIFAYFPGINVDGVGCFWRRSRSLDSWAVKDWKTFARGDGAVAARWLNMEREWTLGGEMGATSRLPALGPFVPSLTPILLVVTEGHLLDAHFFHPQRDQLQDVVVSLVRRLVRDGQQRASSEPVEGPSGFGRCTHAAIGFGYDESSVLVSTYSAGVPSTPSQDVNAAGPNLDMPLNFGVAEDPNMSSWYESWHDQNIVQVCEVQLAIRGFTLSISTTPLPSVRDVLPPNQLLTEMLFVPSLTSLGNPLMVPSTPTPAHRNVTTPQSSPAHTPLQANISQSPGRINRSPMKGTPPKAGHEKPRSRSNPLFLILCSADLGDYNSIRSSIVLFAFFRNPADQQTWVNVRRDPFILRSGVVMSIAPCPSLGTPQHTYALISILDHEIHPYQKGKSTSLSVGKVQVIKLPDLHLDETFKAIDLLRPIGDFGMDLPFNMAVSPNRTHVCTVSSSPLRGARAPIVVELHPTKDQVPAIEGQDMASLRSRRHLAQMAANALQRRWVHDDIVRLLPSTSATITDIEECLSAVLSDLEHSNGLSHIWAKGVTGLAVEAYRNLSHRVCSPDEKSDLESRIETGIDICSLDYYNGLWEDAAEVKGFASDAIWNLVTYSTYFVEELLEKALKAVALHAGYWTILDHTIDGNKHLNSSSAKLPPSERHEDFASELLHFVQPFALDNFIFFLRNISRLRSYLGSRLKDSTHVQLAREVLVDAIASSCVDISNLCEVMEEIQPEVKSFAEAQPELARKCLVALKPTFHFAPMVQKVVARLSQAKLIDRNRLFLKPEDFIDGIAGLTLSPNNGRKHARDIVTKEALPEMLEPLMCVRCNGKSDPNGASAVIPSRPLSKRLWQSRNMLCVCGGAWISSTHL